ncbi:MAG: T9SS type A sorting domain-containing protein [candidate division Zixibacteria bacterium]|nr:T9SS type A sorting domain-containing protein [candidate division Zixibacteria bacterium]
MIDPMHVLTAGHCVYRPSVGFIPDSVIVAPAFDATTSGEFGDARAVQYHFWGGWYYDADWDHDMGIIDLDRPIGGLCGWNGYGYNNSSSFFTGSTFYNPGYPGEYPYTGNYMFTWHGNFDNVYTYQLRVNREAFGGQSGSGAYHTSGGNRTVYCELSNGTSTYHNHVRITQDKYYDINSIISADKPTSVDLIPLAVDIEPSFTYAGYPLDSMSFYVHNYSTVYYNDMVYADIYLSQDSIITTSDVLLQTSSFYAFIDSDSTVKFNVNPPPTLPIIEGDNYFIGVILDIADANPSNNSSNIQDAAYIYVGPAYIAPLTDGVVRSESRTLAHCKYNQNAYYWAVAGVRPPSGSDWDIRVFNDTLFENQMAASVYGGSAVDFVVGNYNSYHNPLGWDGVLVNKYSGVSPCKIEYEGGYDILSAPSQNTGFTWDAGHVVSIWDVYLNAGDTYIYTLDVTGGSFDPGFAIYMPYDGEYYAGRSEAAVLTDAYGSGQDESFAYYAPVTGWYAFVVWSNDDNSGTFNININEDLPVVSIDMIPDNPPVSVRQGGFFTFTGILNNNTDQQLLGDVWIMLRLPNDQMYGPIEQFNNIPMDPYENLTYPGVRQNIPSYAMLGEYEYFAFCGDYPGYITDQASFMFNVTPALASANGNNDWNLLSWFGDETEELPHVSALHDNFPNPFNPVTTIDYDLTSDGDVTLEVYNLMGQKMETLVNGYESAGQKSITWDASTFSSGVYFYRLTTVDNVFTKKMTLMK